MGIVLVNKQNFLERTKFIMKDVVVLKWKRTMDKRLEFFKEIKKTTLNPRYMNYVFIYLGFSVVISY